MSCAPNLKTFVCHAIDQIEEKDATIAELRAELKEQQEEIDSVYEKLRERDALLEEHTVTILSCEEEFGRKEDEVTAL